MGNKAQCCETNSEADFYQRLFDQRISEHLQTSQDSVEFSVINSQLSASAAFHRLRIKPTPLPFPNVPPLFLVARQLSPFAFDAQTTDRRFIVHSPVGKIFLQCHPQVADSGCGDALVSSVDGDWFFEGEIDHWQLSKGLLAFVDQFFIGSISRNSLDEFEPFGNCLWGDAKGSRYKGWMLKGKRHGKGELEHCEGWRYTGDFFEGELTGQGRLHKANGDIYIGALVAGQPHGNGHMSYKSTGESYKGFWQQGKREGLGTFSSASGTYTGEWSNDRMHGRGILQETAGGRYETVWVEGVCVVCFNQVQE